MIFYLKVESFRNLIENLVIVGVFDYTWVQTILL